VECVSVGPALVPGERCKYMKKAFLVSYDLDKPGQNYARIISALERLGAVRVLLSQWALNSTLTAVELRNQLRPFLDSNDRMLVTEIKDWAAINLLSSEQFKKIAA
jgi:hypothetical protein